MGQAIGAANENMRVVLRDYKSLIIDNNNEGRLVKVPYSVGLRPSFCCARRKII